MATKSENKSEEILIRDGLKRHGNNAFRTTLSKGIAATVLKGNDICQIGPDGKISVIAEIKNTGKNKKLTRKSFKIQ